MSATQGCETALRRRAYGATFRSPRTVTPNRWSLWTVAASSQSVRSPSSAAVEDYETRSHANVAQRVHGLSRRHCGVEGRTR